MAKSSGSDENNSTEASEGTKGAGGPWGFLGILFIIGMAWFGDSVFGFFGGDSEESTTAATAATSTTTVSSAPAATTATQSEKSTQAHKPKAHDNHRDSGVATCPVATLPPETLTTINLIKDGGPFPYPNNDGVHFGNYESHLPKEKKSYYREYTVETPGVHHRGERRIVTGGDPAQNPQHWYYTGDHYESFCEIPDAS